jgi:hypothetical protein
LKLAGILVNSQPPSEATAGVPQPPSPVGDQPAINSATLAIANIVGGSGGVAQGTGGIIGTGGIMGTGGIAAGTGGPVASSTGVPGSANTLSFGKCLHGGGILGSILVLLL